MLSCYIARTLAKGGQVVDLNHYLSNCVGCLWSIRSALGINGNGTIGEKCFSEEDQDLLIGTLI